MKTLNKQAKVILIFGIVFVVSMLFLILQENARLKKFRDASEPFYKAIVTQNTLDLHGREIIAYYDNSIKKLAEIYKVDESTKKRNIEVTILFLGTFVFIGLFLASYISSQKE